MHDIINYGLGNQKVQVGNRPASFTNFDCFNFMGILNIR